jgi:hypothetical protein
MIHILKEDFKTNECEITCLFKEVTSKDVIEFTINIQKTAFEYLFIVSKPLKFSEDDKEVLEYLINKYIHKLQNKELVIH